MKCSKMIWVYWDIGGCGYCGYGIPMPIFVSSLTVCFVKTIIYGWIGFVVIERCGKQS